MLTVDRKRLPSCIASMSKKHKAFVSVVKDATVHLSGMHWDGGSRSDYTLVGLISGERKGVGRTLAPWDEQPQVTLHPGVALVESGFFCGKPSTLHVYVLPEDFLDLLGVKTPLLPETPLGIVADWCAENGHTTEEQLLRSVI